MFRFDPFSPEIDADPFPAYRRLREEFPCFWSEEANAWILSRFADIVAALNDWRRYSSTKGNNVAELPNRAGATLGTTDPPRHDQLRALLQHAFLKRNLDSLTGPIRDLARDAAEALRGRKRFDFVGDFCGGLTVKVLSAALGLPPGDEEIVRQNAIMMVQTDPVIRAKGPQHVAAFEWMKAYAAGVIAERRAWMAGSSPAMTQMAIPINSRSQQWAAEAPAFVRRYAASSSSRIGLRKVDDGIHGSLSSTRW